MSAHSPGPWVVRWSEPDSWLDNEVHCAGIDDAEGNEIVTTDSGVYGPYGADALLIGASPELLAALRLALPAVAMHTRHGAESWPAGYPKTEAGDPDMERIAEILRAAIAKATKDEPCPGEGGDANRSWRCAGKKGHRGQCHPVQP